jgi:hypothetical protein
VDGAEIFHALPKDPSRTKGGPPAYITKITKEMASSSGRARGSAETRTAEEIELCARDWALLKFYAKDKIAGAGKADAEVAKQKRPASRPGVADNWRLTTDD